MTDDDAMSVAVDTFAYGFLTTGFVVCFVLAYGLKTNLRDGVGIVGPAEAAAGAIPDAVLLLTPPLLI